jgi:hypothetical protein
MNTIEQAYESISQDYGIDLTHKNRQLERGRAGGNITI